MERPIVIKNQRDQVSNQEAISGKIARNKAQGEAAFLSGEVKPFTGYSRLALATRFDTNIRLDSASSQEVIKRVALPLHKIANGLGMQAIFTGIGDLPPHITIQPFSMKNFDDQVLSEEIDRLSEDRNIRRVNKVLVGRRFLMDTLVVGGNIYLCSSNVSPEAFKTRRLLRRIITGSRDISLDRYIEGAVQTASQNSEPTIAPVDYDDIVHITIGRTTEQASLEQLKSFYEQAQGLGLELSEKPVLVTSTGLYAESSFAFFQRYVPQLLKRA